MRAEALGLFFDESGPSAAPLAALCRDPDTMRLLRDGGEGFVEAIEASGLEPPDTSLLEWSHLMTIEESLERDAVAEMLEESVDDGRLVLERTAGSSASQSSSSATSSARTAMQTTPLARIHAARRQAWLERATDDEQRTLLEAATPTDVELPTPAEAEAAVEPLAWLLERLAGGVKLTQTGALPRVLVREAVERYPDWWDNDLLGPPHREADVYPLQVLHTSVDELGLARPRRGIL